MRLVLFSDLHLDATFAWAPAHVARQRRANLRECLRRIVALADDVQADALLCAGDLYEHEHFTLETVRFVADVLSEAGRPVILAPGNHDPLVEGSLYDLARFGPNVQVVTAHRLEPIDLAPGFRLWSAAHHVKAGTPGFLSGFQVAGADAVHYALFHGSETSSIAGEGARKQPHAPFTVPEIAAAGLHHALVGHYHRPSDDERHTYPGNPDPLTFGETGRRGAVVLDVAADGTPSRTRHVVAVSEVADLPLDVTGAATSDAIRVRAQEALAGRRGAVRLTLAGELDPAIDLHARDLDGLGDGELAVVVRVGAVTVAYDLEALAAETTIRGQFVRDVLATDLDDDERRRVLVTGLRALDGRDDLEVL